MPCVENPGHWDKSQKRGADQQVAQNFRSAQAFVKSIKWKGQSIDGLRYDHQPEYIFENAYYSCILREKVADEKVSGSVNYCQPCSDSDGNLSNLSAERINSGGVPLSEKPASHGITGMSITIDEKWCKQPDVQGDGVRCNISVTIPIGISGSQVKTTRDADCRELCSTYLPNESGIHQRYHWLGNSGQNGWYRQPVDTF